MNNLSELTVIILTYKTNLNILNSCISSIDSKVKIIIIENSSNFIHKNKIINDHKNVSIFCSGSNLGYGGGNNFGLNLVKTKYALILNPDVICSTNFFQEIGKYLSEKNDFSVIGCQYEDNSVYEPAGYFEKKYKISKLTEYNNLDLIKVDWVVGCSLLINLKKFSNRNIFDENFFLFFEEFDLCKKLKKNGENVYSSRKLIINHLGFKSTSDFGEDLAHSNKLRSWHFAWSYFYYHKKNEGYFSAFMKSIGKICRSFLKMIFFSIIFNKNKRINYTYRFLGFVNSLFGRKSFFRIE